MPGGPVYVTRGTIDVVRNEAELAGVMAHEISHVALRHGTNQASKAYLTKAGIGILGGVLGAGGGSAGSIIQAVGGLGMNVLFLKFSRTAETQADIMGTQIMAQAGYDPVAMVTMFQLLKSQQAQQPGKVAQFFSDHPSPENREARVRQEAQALRAGGSLSVVGGLENAQVAMRRLPRASSMSQIAQAAQSGQTQGSSSGYPSGSTAGAGSVARIEQPSTRMRSFRQRDDFFQIQYPDNWRVSEGSGYGVTILPPGGAIRGSNGADVLVYGVVINHYEPFGGVPDDVWAAPVSGQGSLEQATNDLANELSRANPHLRAVSGSMRRQTLDNARAVSVVLAGRSPVTGADERVTVFTRELPDGHVLYALFVAPAQDYTALSRTFQSMVSSIRINDRAAHQEHAH